MTLIDKACRAGALLACISIVAMVVIIVAQVIARQFGVIIPAVEELCGYLLVAACFSGLGWTWQQHGHIQVELVLKQLPTRYQRRVSWVTDSLLLGLSGFMTVACAHLALDSYWFNEVSAGYLPIPEWIPQSVMIPGSGLLFLAVLQHVWRRLNGETTASEGAPLR